MVICKFFQTGNCRFGAKCANEHFDVKQLIKTEIEAALQGRQWPLSTFGPFKEKPCFPNFIEDQSFEEIRYHCYEAKKQNYFPNFEQQFSQQVMEAENKMKTLLTLNREIVDIVTNIYDSSSENGQQKSSTFTGNSNPFAAIGANNNTQQAGGLFGTQTQQVNPFAKPNTQSGFGSNSTGIFGGSGQSSNSGILGQSTFGNSIFGGNTTSQQVQPSIFTSPIRQQQQSSFGGFVQQSQPSNIFSQTTQQQQPPAGSIFGGQVQSQTQQPFGSNMFAQPLQNASQPNPFGTAVQPIGGNIFPQANQQTQQSTVFGGFVQPSNEQKFPAPPTQNLFGAQPNPLQQQSIFGTQQQTQQQIQTQQQQAQLQHLQQPLQPLQPQPLQQQQQHSLQQQPLQQLPQQQPPQTNIFAQQQSNQAIPVTAQQSLFGGTNHQQQTQPNFNQMTASQNQNIFAQPQQAQQNQLLQQQQHQSKTSDISGFRIGVYSKMEDLSPDDIQSFQADKFLPGKIPCNPPPRELC